MQVWLPGVKGDELNVANFLMERFFVLRVDIDICPGQTGERSSTKDYPSSHVAGLSASLQSWPLWPHKSD